MRPDAREPVMRMVCKKSRVVSSFPLFFRPSPPLPFESFPRAKTWLGNNLPPLSSSRKNRERERERESNASSALSKGVTRYAHTCTRFIEIRCNGIKSGNSRFKTLASKSRGCGFRR